ncbi:MAG: GNAT family N-acetyltransferase [Pyrinomonadaceae bacterium]
MSEIEPSDLKITHAERADIPEIIELIGAIWREYNCVLDAQRDEPMLLVADTYFPNHNGCFWVARRNGKLTGTGAVLMLDRQTAELKSLYVATGYREHGLGEQLTRIAIGHARRHAAQELILWSDTRFLLAHRLYERLGFERNGARSLGDVNHTTEYRFHMSLI